MKKKTIVAVSLSVILVGLIVLLSFTAFSLKEVEVDFRTSHSHITATDSEIIQEANFKMGASVFFHGKKEYTQKIEESNPYIKVINIETVFPSKFVIHIAERQEVYAISYGQETLICDEKLRILKIESDFVSTQSNAILLNLESPLPKKTYQAGDYIEKINIPPIYEAMFENNRTLGAQIELVESITLSTEVNAVTHKEQQVATLNFFSGQTVRIVNTSYGLVSKIKLMLDVYSQLFNFIGKTLITDEGEVVLAESNLKTCTIEINNYLHPDRKEKECYFDIFL